MDRPMIDRRGRMAHVSSLALAAALLLGTGAHAQNRASYDTGSTQCEEWSVGFEYSDCRRVLFPGAEAEYVQVYIKPDGTRENFLNDPGVSTPAAANRPTTAAATAAPRPAAGTTRVQNPIEAPSQASPRLPQRLPTQVTMFPGRTELLPVAIGHLNRLETPFRNPKVRTSAPETALNISNEGSFLFVSVTEPATIIIHEAGKPDPAITVSLLPRQITPRQVRLGVTPPVQRQIDANLVARPPAAAIPASASRPAPVATRPGVRAGSSAPHVTQIATVMQAFGQGNVARGYDKTAVRNFRIEDFCRTNVGVNFSLRGGQAYADRDYIMLIARATSSSRRSLQEVWCAAHPATAAVAYTPRTVISQGRPAEVLIMLRRDLLTRPAPQRQRVAQ